MHSSLLGCEFTNEELPLTRFAYFAGHEQFHPETLVDHAVAAEKAGFDAIVISEHFHPWVDDLGASGFAYATIAAMAQATSKVDLITGVTTPLFRFHPGVVAQAAATLDRLSGGRFELGVGTGENLNEGPLGYSFPNYAERAARMREALEIMRRLLDGEKLTFDGQYYVTDRARLYSPPLRRVPIWLAAGGPKSAVLAAEMADGVITSVKVPADTMEKVIDPANAAAAKAGKKAPSVIATRWSIYAEDEDQMWTALGAWRGLRAPGRLEAVDPQDLRERADEMDRSEILDLYSRVTNADQIVETYTPLIKDIDAHTVVIQMTGLNQHAIIDMLGLEVLPRLREL